MVNNVFHVPSKYSLFSWFSPPRAFPLINFNVSVHYWSKGDIIKMLLKSELTNVQQTIFRLLVRFVLRTDIAVVGKCVQSVSKGELRTWQARPTPVIAYVGWNLMYATHRNEVKDNLIELYEI